MTTLTLVTLAVMIFGVFNRGGYGRALALGGGTAAGAAVAVGATTVPTFYAVAFGALGAVGLGLLGNGQTVVATRRRLPPGTPQLLLFLVWSTFVTLVAPVLFAGLRVLIPTDRTRQLVPGEITTSNIAQFVYLLLGIGVVIFLARSRLAGPELIGLAAGTTIVLSFWRYLHQIAGLPFPERFFDNSPAFVYIETAANNVQRFRGILSEPAALAVSCLVTISYMLPRSLQVRGWRRAGALTVASLAAYLGAISTSTTFLVAGGVVAIIVATCFGVGFLLRRRSVNAIVSVVGCTFVIAALWVLPRVAAFIETTVNQKITSSSYTDRSTYDAKSYGVFLDTFGFGVGLGGNRASSFLPGLLSTTGVIGTLLFASAVATLIYRASSVRAYRPVVWALVTTLVVKVVSGPDLSDSSGILWMSIGLLSHAVWAEESHDGSDPDRAARIETLPEPPVRLSPRTG